MFARSQQLSSTWLVILFPTLSNSTKYNRKVNFFSFSLFLGFPGGSAGKQSACNAGNLGSIPGFGRSPGEGEGYSLQYSGLENSMDCIIQGVAKSQTQLNDFHFLSLLASSIKSTIRNISRKLSYQKSMGLKHNNIQNYKLWPCNTQITKHKQDKNLVWS